jgi:hypothetical protein
MRLFSKASLQFNHPKDNSIKAVVRAGQFSTVPDWVVDSAMFKLASADETITVIESAAQEVAAEKSAGRSRKAASESADEQ